MLACARIGAIHSMVFGGFAAKELATRIDDAKPKLILSASCGVEPSRIVEYKPLLDQAIALAHAKPAACLILQRPQGHATLIAGRDFDWASLRADALAAIKKEDPQARLIGRYDLSKFRTLFLAGERADPDTVKWAEDVLKVPVIDHWWQTETGWCIAGNPVGLGALPVKYGSATVPMPGYQVDVVDEAARPLPAGSMGSIVIKLPMPPACLPTLWEQDQRFKEAYLTEFPGYYKTSDAGYKDEDGYIFVMGRTDDIINVAGHRLSTGGIEEILASHPDVAQCAGLGVKDAIKGEVPCGFLVLKAGVTKSHAEVEKDIVALVRDKLGPVAAFKLAITVARLPKTRSGKILRGTIKKIADGEPWTMPATIEDPKVLDEISAALKGRV